MQHLDKTSHPVYYEAEEVFLKFVLIPPVEWFSYFLYAAQISQGQVIVDTLYSYSTYDNQFTMPEPIYYARVKIDSIKVECVLKKQKCLVKI